MVPPTVSPYGSNRYLNTTSSNNNNNRNRLSPNNCGDKGNSGAASGFVNKGWNLLQDVFTSSSSASLSATDGRKAR